MRDERFDEINVDLICQKYRFYDVILTYRTNCNKKCRLKKIYDRDFKPKVVYKYQYFDKKIDSIKAHNYCRQLSCESHQN